MIIEYDRTQGISAEQRLQTLMESVQLAINEIENQLAQQQKQIDSLQDRLSILLRD